ncbi:CapA family protein [Halobacillus campisalis]|uniref:CapA family protein n=1 Tax=Halobacillus campisalis TaxID=435909 RepID=A0ABW2JZU9_9BACI|nr:CapA family protein [Halobacillus campisalis]
MVKMFVSGDIVNYEHNDGLICSEGLSNVISAADYSVCNFEAPIEKYGSPIPKSGPHHFQRKGTIDGIKQQGFNMMCLANNHIMDYGSAALKATIDEARSLKLDTIGAGLTFDEAYKPVIKTVNDLKVGFINASEAQFGVKDYYSDDDQPGYAWINHKEIDRQITILNQECDFVIVLSHAGLENYSIPQKEWRNRYKHFCDLGADVIVGSHPHVPQGYEHYNDSLIFYSLGNFYFDSKNYHSKEDRSYSVMLKFDKNEKVSFEPVFHHKEDGHVQLSTIEKQVNLEELNSKLGDGYEKLHEEMSLQIYNKTIKKNLIYSLVPFTYDGSLKSSVKRALGFLLKRRKKPDKTLLSVHLLRNEAYYYATKHAMEIIAREKYGRR